MGRGWGYPLWLFFAQILGGVGVTRGSGLGDRSAEELHAVAAED